MNMTLLRNAKLRSADTTEHSIGHEIRLMAQGANPVDVQRCRSLPASNPMVSVDHRKI